MAIIEPKQGKQDPRGLLLGIALLAIGLAAVGGVLYWLLAPARQRQVALTEDQVKQVEQAGETRAPRGPAFPPAPALPAAEDPGPTLVTLDLTSALPQAVLAEMAKQGKTAIQSMGGNSQGFLAALTAKRVNVSASNQPFWEVMRDVCRESGLSPFDDYNNRGQITLRKGEQSEFDCPTVSAGSCMLVLRGVTSTFDSDVLSARPPGRSLNVSLVTFVEPKLSAYRINPTATIEEAADENGKSLIRPRGQWDDRGSSGGNRSNWMGPVECQLNFPADAGQRIARLKGYASVVLAGSPQTVTLKDPLSAKNSDQTIGGTTVRVVSVRKQGEGMYEATFLGDAKSPIFKEWETFSKIATMRDGNGKKFNQQGGSWGGGTRTAMEFSLSYQAEQGASEPTQMDITLPTELRELRIPFDFTDLPLPH